MVEPMWTRARTGPLIMTDSLIVDTFQDTAIRFRKNSATLLYAYMFVYIYICIYMYVHSCM